MATYNKFNVFTYDLLRGAHSLQSGVHECYVMLSNVLPLATNSIKANITEITQVTNGYTAGGLTIAPKDVTVLSAGTAQLLTTGADPIWTMPNTSTAKASAPAYGTPATFRTIPASNACNTAMPITPCATVVHAPNAAR